ncbi:MAG: DUF6951 family protein [Candidatus Methanomethylophilaceae archaeon]|jgi:hypothetical protein
MGECNIRVLPGVCKLDTTIKATVTDDWKVVFQVESDCPSVMKLAEALGEMDPMKNLDTKIGETEVYLKANDTIAHTACPVPCAMIKAIEVASDMGLKRDVVIEIR